MHTQFDNPLGEVVARCRRHRGEITVGTVDLGSDDWWHGTEWGRTWRDSAREGGIYRAKAGL